MYRYSIIVPVCNIQAGHLTQCLNSVKQQSYGEYECILVKDAKTDPNVVEFVEKWVEEHKNKFKLISNQLECCHGTARNIGVRNATGDFIIFLDAFDYIEHSMLETLDKYAEKHRNVDILSYSAMWLRENQIVTKTEPVYEGWPSYTITNINLSHNLIKDKVHTFSKCYARSFLLDKDIWHLDKTEFGIDLHFHIVSYSKANQIFVINEPLYNRRVEFHKPIGNDINHKEKLFNIMDYAFAAFETIRRDDSILAKYFYTFFKFFFETYMIGEYADVKKEEWWSDVYARFTKMYQWLIKIGH